MAKTRQRRIVELSPNVGEWLAPFKIRRPPFICSAFQRHFHRIKSLAGFTSKRDMEVKDQNLRPWIQDYMRHTAISMHLALHKHEGETAIWAGNSPNVIQRHYKGLVKEAEATEFWSLTPQMVASEIVPLRDLNAVGGASESVSVMAGK